MESWITKRNEEIVHQYKNFPWHNKEVYGNYLAQTFHFVKHSTRLLASAAGRMDNTQEKIFRRFTKHISEEQSHEVLAERDLKNLGYNLSDFSELGITQAFYQAQYYQIEHVSPFSLLGYILMLESLGVGGCGYAAEQAGKFFGTKCATFLKVHADEDPDHVEKAYQTILSLPLNEQKVIWQNYELTHQNYSLLLSTISNNSFRSVWREDRPALAVN